MYNLSRVVDYEWFNVKEYGALGVLDVDYTTQIQAAISAAVANGGGVVYFPKGNYKVTDLSGAGANPAISIGGSSIIFQGAGVQATIIRVASTGGWHGPGIGGDGTRRYHFTMRDMEIYADDTTITKLIYMNDLDMSYFENVRIQGNAGETDYGIHVYGNNGGATRNFFQNVHVLACVVGIWFDYNSNSARVIGGEFQSNGKGILIFDSAPTTVHRITNTYIAGATFECPALTKAGPIGIHNFGIGTTIVGCRYELVNSGASVAKVVGNFHAWSAWSATVVGSYYALTSGSGTMASVINSGSASLRYENTGVY